MKVNKTRLYDEIETVISQGVFCGEEVDITTKKIIDLVRPLVLALENLGHDTSK